MKRFSLRARRKPARKYRRTPFKPPEPEIVIGTFKGQKLSEFSDEELTSFLRSDAQFQIRAVTPNAFAFPPTCQDLSQYWFAKYELERRKEPAGYAATSSFTLAPD